MTTIKATCPSCGEVGLTPDQVELWVSRIDVAASFYAFTCSSCLSIVRKPADERVIRLLVSGGVALLELEAATPSPRPRFDHPTLTHDDLLDFHTLLQDDTWFDNLVTLNRRENVGN